MGKPAPRKSVPIEAGGRTYNLRYTTNALIEIEEHTGLTIQELGEKFTTGRVGLRDMRIFVWAGVLHEHPDFTLAEAGYVIDHRPPPEPGTMTPGTMTV